MIQQIKDRLPTLPGRWLVTHEDNTTEYVTVTRADEPTEAGTSFNKALFGNLQGDVYTGVQYNTPTYSGSAMTLDLPLTSYETGKIVNIKAPATFSSYPTLNINGLGAKTVNSMLVLNKNYSLIYNGTSFDVISNDIKDIFYTTTNSGSNFSVNIPINSYETNMIIKIKANADDNTPTLNVNGLGTKTVNTTFIENKEYVLMYNGTSWDSLSAPQIITTSGNYALLHSKYYCVAIGGGGGLGRGTGTGGRDAYGGDGGLVAGIFTPTSSTTTVTIGAVGSNANGQASGGGNTQIGFFTAYGGTGGKGGSGSTGSASNAPTPGIGGKGIGGAILEGVSPQQEGSSSTWVLPIGHTLEGSTYGKGTSTSAGTSGVVILYPLL